jgi:ATP-dependent DNA helicase RecG
VAYRRRSTWHRRFSQLQTIDSMAVTKNVDACAMNHQLLLKFTRGPLELLTADEIYDDAERLVQDIAEDRRIERKPPKLATRSLGDYFSMWANTPPDGGLLVVGLGDKGEKLGFGDCLGRVNEIEKCGAVYCPDAQHHSRRVPLVTDKGKQDFLILFRVYYNKHKVVRTTSGEAFHRVADEKRTLTAGMIHELEIDKGQIDLELEPTPFAYPEEFDSNLLDEYAHGWRVARDLPQKDLFEILTLSHLGVMTRSGFRPNTACALLFAKRPTKHFPGCRIRFLRFEGESEGSGSAWNAVKNIWIDDGPVPRLIQGAEAVIESQLRTFEALGQDGKFYTTQEYPKEAWYEALVNACAHRSYGLKNMSIYVKMFDDRIEVESPGSFPPLVTASNIYDIHSPRNPHLMDALYYLRFVQCAHEGARRIRDKMAAMKLPPPIFKQSEGDFSSVLVMLRNNVKQRRVWVDKDVASIISAAILSELSEIDRRAINFVAEYGQINVTQMQRLVACRWHAAKKTLMRLVDMRILEHRSRPIAGKGRDSKAHFVLRNGRRA